jgi:hypothetical protein
MRDIFRCEFLNNASTGMHVHIGDTQGHSLETTKRIAQIASVHERLLDQLHSADRIPMLLPAPLPDLDNNIIAPLFGGMSFFHASNDYGPSCTSILSCVEQIEKAETLVGLGQMQRVRFQGYYLDGHSCTLNLDNLYPNPDTSLFATIRPATDTIEFRQHGGDLYGPEIVAYIKFLANLTAYCHQASDREIVNLLVLGMSPSFSLEDLMHHLDCDGDVIDHFCNPRHRLPSVALNPALQPLLNINHQESVARRHPDNVKAAIDAKKAADVYGIVLDDDDRITLQFEESIYDWMIDCARADITAEDNLFGAELGISSRALGVVFAKLARIYTEQDGTDHPYQQVIVQELKGWSDRYGSPGGS